MNTVRHKSNLEIVCIWSPLSWMLIHFCFSTCFAKKIFSMRLSWTIVPSGSDSGCHLNKNIRPYTGLKSKIKFGWILLSNSYKPTLYVTQQWILIKSKCIKNLFTHTNTTKIIEKIFNTLITYHAYNCWKKILTWDFQNSKNLNSITLLLEAPHNLHLKESKCLILAINVKYTFKAC